MSLLVGTASWTDKTLIASGRFYPKQATSAEARLRYYASQFPLVEVDSSYYAMPAPATAQLWAERTPEGFVMNVKAFRLFTGHQTSPTVLHKDLQTAVQWPRTRRGGHRRHAISTGAFARRSRCRRRRVRPSGGYQSRGAGDSSQIRRGRRAAQYRA
jgi:uncharacterized protein YecE (DUF72 family)